LLPSCVNGGGESSILRLGQAPVLDQEVALGPENRPALVCWRARPGELLTALDAQNRSYRIRLTQTGENPRGTPFVRLSGNTESPLLLEVYQALPEKERFELVLQKLTELGVSRIVPVETMRSSTQKLRDVGQVKSHRWPEIVLRASKQCRRAKLPELYATASFAAALTLARTAELKLMLYEGEGFRLVTEALGSQRPKRVALLVGPEGGFAAEEVSAACAAGFQPVSLGPRILRTETAAIAGTVLLQGLLGDLC
jgi:16S rRNA (uracil1498-N3)-methyltransferase